jgi:hypothetical protein
MTRYRPALGLLLLLMVAASACSGSPSGEPNDTISLTSTSGRTARLRIEVADTQEERQKGLSMRESLDANAGMLFVIEQRGPGFWMKDTTIPLSVAFIAACGEIVAIADMQPLSLQIHTTERDYRFGLEVNQGWFARNGIAVGDRVQIPAAYRQPGCA